MVRSPEKSDKFSFGLWTVGWTGTDPFGVATRPALEPWAYAEKLAELGAWGVTFHDNDVYPFGSSELEKARIVARFQEAVANAGLVIEMVTEPTSEPTSTPKPTPSPTPSSRTVG